MPKKRSGANKSEFVRSQPATLSAEAVVAKAKEAGLAITAGLVYSVRSAEKTKSARRAKGAKASKSAPAAPAPAATAHDKAGSGKMSASDFIRSLPSNTPAKSTVKKGAAQGYSFKSGLVYKVRRGMRKSQAKGTVAAPAAASKRAHASTGATGHKAEFRELMLLIGLDQAEAFCAEMRRGLKEIAGE